MTKNRIKVGRDRNKEWRPDRKDYKGNGGKWGNDSALNDN